MDLKGILKSSNNRMYKLLLILLAGICLMIVVWPVSKKQDEDMGTAGRSYTKGEGDAADDVTTDFENNDAETGMTATAAYAENMEKRLTDMLNNMNGISDVSVMITVKDSGEKVALKDRSTSKSEGSGSSQSRWE